MPLQTMQITTGLDKKKVLLGLLPYWTPAIPPLGISCLKSHLQQHGYRVTTYDANMRPEFRELYDEYFKIIDAAVPNYRRGNFFNMGMDVMKNHMMAHLHQKDQAKHVALVRDIIYKTFYSEVSDRDIQALSGVLDEFYERLGNYQLDLLDTHKPDVFGLSVFSGSFPASVFAFKLCKEHYPDTMTVMGGGIYSDQLAEHSINFEYFYNNSPFLDKFIIGEGEALFLKMLEGEFDHGKRVLTQADLGKDTIKVNEAPVPDFDDIELDNYPQLGAYTSRSCPWQCSFCSETVHWGTYRKKSGEQIVEELKTLYKKHGHQLFMMGDSLLNPVINSLTRALEKEDVKLYYDGYIRADRPVCDVNNTLSWRRGGFYRARLGVESGSQHVLDLMSKSITPDQIRAAVRSLAAAGIKTTTYWVVGHPGETEDDFQKTLDIIEELQDDIWEAECNPFNYFLSGQVDSDKWMSEYKRVTLYPEDAMDQLVTQTWIMQDCYPQREEIYQRVNRFVDHCARLGIPNPYFMHEINQADERWKVLHKNAVPPIIDFKDKHTPVIENVRMIKPVQLANVMREEGGDFAF